MRQKQQAIKTLIGAIIIKLGTGILSCWGVINLYFLSYFYEKGQNITQKTNSILVLAFIIPMSIFVLFAPKLADMIGYQRIIKLSSYIFFISPLFALFYFTIQTMVIFCMIIPCAAFGIGAVSLFYCIWSQFPDSKNKATSLVIVFYGLGSVLWNYTFTMIVNPNNEMTTVYDQKIDMSFFGENITKNVRFALNFCFFFAGILNVIGSQFIRENKDLKQQKHIGQQTELREYSPPQIYQNGILQKIKKNDIKQKKQPSLKQTLVNQNFIIVFVIGLLSGIFQIFISMNIKIIYMPIVQDDHFLAYSIMIGLIISITGSFIWGYLGDRYGFVKCLLLFTFFDCLFKIYGCFANTKTSIMIMFILLGLTDKGMLTLMGPGFVQLFGIKMATKLLPFKGISIFLAYGLGPLMYILSKGHLQLKSFMIFLWTFSVISLILGYRLYKKLN